MRNLIRRHRGDRRTARRAVAETAHAV